MKPGWYVLGFHEVSWEENPYLSGLPLTCPPDAFAKCVASLARVATLASVAEGHERWRAGALDRAYVSFWFDDGYVGVRRYAAPILARHGVSGALSVNSRFTSRTEMFWRAKLSYLSYRDGMRFVRSRLRARGHDAAEPVRHATLDLFSPELVADVDTVYRRFTSDADRADAFRIFDDWDGVRALASSGWTIANHTAAHYPVLEPTALPLLCDQFAECERELEAQLGVPSAYWVAPFDRKPHRAPAFQATFDACAGGRTLVLVGNAVNRDFRPGKPIERIGPPPDLASLPDLLARLPD
ncbi:polysaccharide deacetylase [Gemmatirosa kalamazoonensis]|uniref:Polysaccharide deacetylase n=1 Tax=Gemmatirosa kalamazoonensis TaxID=861299 RepID=W0RM86_9BACT|nr:polysaccharide deacetylase family protein [Gemmatirosa kalamazoonensis]AHG90553.1 polysaccharide deacetylase [Gemmatirosa kalamazoonensis]